MTHASNGSRWPRRQMTSRAAAAIVRAARTIASPARVSPRRMLRSVAIGAACLLGAAACQQEVTNPSVITPNNLTGPSSLPTIRDAAIGDFAIAYTGSGADGSQGIEGVIMASGLLSDELVNSETFPTRIEVDRRSISLGNSDVALWFRGVQKARASTEFAVNSYRQLSPDTTKASGFPEMLALSGFTYLFLAENWCSGVPVSNIAPDGTLQFGMPLTTTALYDTAASRFAQALNAAKLLPAGAARSLDSNLAAVGLARTILDSTTNPNRSGFAAAAAAVAGVPTSFVYEVFHSNNNTREWNGIYTAMAFARRYSVADSEGSNTFNQLHLLSQPDGRDPLYNIKNANGSLGTGFDGSTPQWNDGRYLTPNDPDPLATGAEARLIEAEAALAAGDTATMLAKLNALRASPPSYFAAVGGAIGAMAPLTTAGLDSTGVQNLLFTEREHWLFNSAHRLGDLRRLSKTPGPYERAPESVFPHGAYFKGGVYGTDYNFPVTLDETNNPNFTACINRNP